jgi:hypothetical protein
MSTIIAMGTYMDRLWKFELSKFVTAKKTSIWIFAVVFNVNMKRMYQYSISSVFLYLFPHLYSTKI